MASQHCTCSIVQLQKNGYTDDPDAGVLTCHKCQKPTIDPVRATITGQRVRGVVTPRDPMLIVTMNDIPGYEITEVHGDVFGLTVRARDMFSNFGASMRTIVGGEVGGYTQLLNESRLEARGRLIDAARQLGANAVVAMRFDCNDIGDIISEIAAYGTAVTARRIIPPAIDS